MAETRRRHPNGDTYCAACKRLRYDTFKQRHPEKVAVYRRRSFVRKSYGLEPAAYDELLADQNGVCAVCRGGFGGTRSLHVDHDHATGNVRGLLCHNCNTAIGLMKDDPERLRAAIEYLRQAGRSKASRRKKK